MRRNRLLALGAALLFAAVFVFISAAPAAAYSGVTGATFDSATTQPWEHGGTVFVIGNTVNGGPNPVLIGTASLATTGPMTGTFSFDWSGLAANDQPIDFTNVTVVIQFNFGGVGTPATQQYTNQFTQFSFIPGQWNMGNITTGTGPTAVSLQGIGGGSGFSLPPLLIGAVMLLGVGALLLMGRRFRHQ